MAHVLAAKPCAIKPAQKKKLEAAGVIIVEMDDPSDLRIVRVESAEVEGNDITWAALAAIDDSGLPTVAVKFTANLRAIMARKMRERHPDKSSTERASDGFL